MTRTAEPPTPPLLFCTERYRYLAAAMAGHAPGAFVGGEIERRVFPDGERYQRIVTPLAGREVVLVGGTISDDDTLELFDLACSVVKYGGARLTLVLPYFGYSTMERANRPQEVVTAKTRARLLSAVPVAARGNRVVLLDLHSEGIPHYFEGAVSPVHLYARPLVTAAARRLAGVEEHEEPTFVLACTDAGRAKWVESLANDIGVNAAFVFKRRVSGSETTITAVSAYVDGKQVIIYDDMVRTGGSLLSAARAYREAGAVDVAAITTHGLFSDDALARLASSGLLSAMVCTDSHPRPLALNDHGGFLQIASVAGLLADFLAEAEGSPAWPAAG